MPESDVEAALERLREAHRWPLHFVGQVDAFQREWPIIERHIAEQTRKLDGYARECMEVDQSLGKALGYPWYKDDPVNFPDATEADGVCTGEHVPGSIAAEAANRIKAQAQEIERLRKFVREVLYDHLEIDKQSQCPWCLWVPGRSWEPIHECSAIEMVQVVGTRAAGEAKP